MEQKELILTSIRLNQFDLLFKQLEIGGLPDTVDYLSNIEHDEFWKCINKYTKELIASLNLDDGDDDDENNIVVEEHTEEQLLLSISLLKQIIQIIPLYFKIKHRSEYLLQTIQDLHDILIPLNDELFGATSLKTAISRICEHWWIKEENGAENLITQLIPFYLLTSLGPKSVDADIKRVFNIRGSFMLLDFDDPSIESISNLLVRCFINPSYLKVSEGRRFLAYLFSVNQGLHSLFVSVMKPQLGAGIKGISSSYGDILFRAFKESKGISTDNNNGPTDKEIEISDMMQGIVHEAIHACDCKYFKSLRTVLSVFSNQKNVKGVDSFLLVVYGPILWRSLRCANALVRVQATILFFDTFPLHDPDSSAQDGDTLLQKQFDLLTSLLKDSDHRVRSSAASGVCHILRDFWSSVPTSTTKQILSYVVGTLGSDASCSNVRLAVVSGLGELLEQPLSHSVLKNLLPLLANTIHDSAEKVRIGFIEILCKVKSIRGMHFYNIVPVDQLIQRLQEDCNKPAITNVMTKLLLHSYYPQGDKSVAPMGPEQTRRCIKFVRHNSIAAEAFYSNLLNYTSVGSVSKLSIMIFTLFIDDFSGYNFLEDDTDEVGAVAVGVGIEDKKDSGGKRRRNTNDSSNNNLLSDSTLLSGMMRVLLTCFSSISDKVTHENHSASYEILRSFFTTESILKVFLSLIEKEKNDTNLSIIPTYVKLIALVNKSLLSLENGDEDEEESDSLLKTLVFESYQSTCLSQGVNAQLEHAIATVEIFFVKGQMDVLFQAIYDSFQFQYDTIKSISGKKQKNKKNIGILSFESSIVLLGVFIESDSKIIQNAKSEIMSINTETEISKIEDIFLLIRQLIKNSLEKNEESNINIDHDNSSIRCIHLWSSYTVQRYYNLINGDNEDESMFNEIASAYLNTLCQWVSDNIVHHLNNGGNNDNGGNNVECDMSNLSLSPLAKAPPKHKSRISKESIKQIEQITSNVNIIYLSQKLISSVVLILSDCIILNIAYVYVSDILTLWASKIQESYEYIAQLKDKDKENIKYLRPLIHRMNEVLTANHSNINVSIRPKAIMREM